MQLNPLQLDFSIRGFTPKFWKQGQEGTARDASDVAVETTASKRWNRWLPSCGVKA